jgi:hypothetical protein
MVRIVVVDIEICVCNFQQSCFYFLWRRGVDYHYYTQPKFLYIKP